jgi:pyruvate,orthophosphate dikinase
MAKAKKTAATSRGRKPVARRRTTGKKYVYFFGNGKADGDRTMKDTLGGKGAGLAEMTRAGLPVPPGLTISTDACNLYYELGQKLTPAIEAEIVENTRKLEMAAGAVLGSPTNPLLVSVRSGAKFSMPGMMDTILNLGLNDTTVEGLKRRTSNGRFAFDSYRRFIQMFGSVVLEIPKADFEHEFEDVKKQRGAALDTDLDEEGLREVVERFKKLVRGKTRKEFPQDPAEQLRLLEQSARPGIPADLRHSRFHRHGRQRADDGIRQYRRPVGHRRRFHAKSCDRRQRILR